MGNETASEVFAFSDKEDGLVDGALMVGSLEKRTASNGNSYFSGEAYDRGGTYRVVLWNKDVVAAEPAPGAVIVAKWKCKMYMGAPQLDVHTLYRIVALDELNDASPFIRASCVTRQVWMNHYTTLMEPLIEDASLRTLLRHILTTDDAFFRAPAAKVMHQHWRGGLAEHTHRLLTLFYGLCRSGHPSIAACRKGIVIAGLVLHDWLKTLEYEEIAPGKYEVGMWGELIGHLAGGPLAVQRILVEQQIEIADTTRMHLFHVLLAHHGQVDWGSPVTPKTPEATIVHFLDNMDGRLSAIEEAGDGGKSRMVGGKAYLFPTSP